MRVIVVLLVSLIFASCGTKKTVVKDQMLQTPIAIKSDNERIVDCFSNYKTAILNDSGLDAVNYVDSRTINYYQEILEKTKNADSLTISNMSIMDKLMVFSIRHRTPKDEILQFDGRKLLVYAIEKGMVGKNSVANNEIGKIEIDHKFAKGQFVVGGNPTPLNLHFYNEQENWKIDLTSLFPIANQAFQQMADESGLGENEYLFMLLEMITGETPSKDIFKTVKN